MIFTRLEGLRALSVPVLAALAASCADPSAAYDDFATRETAAEADDSSGACAAPAPGQMDGDYFGTLATALSSRPLFLHATLQTEAQGRGLTTWLTLHWLSKMDRATPVSDPLSLPPFLIEEDGSFMFDVNDWTIPKEAGPIAATVSVTFVGRACGDGSFVCGELESKSDIIELSKTSPSTFTFQRIKDPEAPPEPLLDCDRTPLSSP